MPQHSISDLSLQRFARGEATREEKRTVLAHLLRGCTACSRALQAMAGPPPPASAAPARPAGAPPAGTARQGQIVH